LWGKEENSLVKDGGGCSSPKRVSPSFALLKKRTEDTISTLHQGRVSSSEGGGGKVSGKSERGGVVISRKTPHT